MARSIEPKMVEWLDKKLKVNGLVQDAIARKDARTVMLKAAEACVGIREKSGKNDGPMVELIQETVGNASREAWCMSFVQTCIAYAEVKTGAKSPLKATEHCLTLWNGTPASQKVKISPLPGAIAIWRHGKTTSGHTGFFREWQEEGFAAVEGNTNSGQSIGGPVVREGGGVYHTLRDRSGTGSMKLLGFIRPF